MNPVLFISLLFVSAAMAALGVSWILLGWYDAGGRRIKQRLGQKTPSAGVQEHSNLLLRQHEKGAFAEILGRYHVFQELRLTLKQAMPDLRLETFLCITGAAGLVVLLTGFALTGSVIVSCVAALIGIYAPFLVVSRKRMRRQKLLAEQLPDGLDFLNRSLRAGHSLPLGLQMMGTELPAPLGEEFGRCYDEISLGCGTDDALKAMTERIESTDFAFFITAILVQRQTGGDLSQVLANITEMLRQRIQLQQHVKARTAEGRFTGLILAAFPMVMFLILFAMNRQYAELLITTTVGKFFLASALVLSAIGLHIIRRITTVNI